MRWILRLLANAAALAIATWILSGITLTGSSTTSQIVTLLVVAKPAERGRAKTRLAATVGDRVAAEIAAAALLDTLDAVAATPVAARVVALTGELDAAG